MRYRWPGLSEARREALVRRAIEWASADVSREFGRLYRVALTDESPSIRQLAVLGLWEDQRPDLVELLLDVVETDASTDVRAQAIATLGGLLEQRDIEDISSDEVERLRDLLLDVAGDEEDASILRRAAVEALGGFGDDEEAEEVIRLAASEDDAALQAAAIYAMGTTRGARWETNVLPALKSEDPEVRAAAARAAGLIGMEDAVEAVIELTGDADDEVRHAAITALGGIATPPATKALRLLLQDATPEDEPVIEAALDEATIGSDADRAPAGW